MFRRKLLRCSFCRKDETKVAKLVAGPRVYICDECVQIASRFMEGDADSSNLPRVETSVWQRFRVRVQKLFRPGGVQRTRGEESLA